MISRLKQFLWISGLATFILFSFQGAWGDNPSCPPTNNGVTDPSFIQECTAAAKLLTGSCPIFETCPAGGQTKLWAQLRVDGDLMKEEVARIGVPPSSVKVAVLDTGFDSAGNLAKVSCPHVRVARAYDGTREGYSIGDPADDVKGHGTNVSGTICGSNGVGLAPNVDLTVYRLTSAKGGGESSLDAFAQGALRACEEGNEVINYSWGNHLDETDASPDEKVYKKLLKKLADKGCVVIKAAGNSSYVGDRSSDVLDGPLVRVGAIEPTNNRADFSSHAKGEFQAPGEGVFTLESTRIPKEDRAEDANKCGTQSGRFVNGTSFAAPITTAIAAQVLGVLKTGPAFEQLQGPDQVKLLNRILQASVFDGSVNGLRAVLIAERWKNQIQNAPGKRSLVAKMFSRKEKDSIAAVSELSQLLTTQTDPICSKPWHACSEIDCPQKKACINVDRKRLALCGSPDPKMLKEMLQSMLDSDNLGEAAYLLRTLNATSNAGDLSAQSNALIEKYKSRNEKIISDRNPYAKPAGGTIGYDLATAVGSAALVNGKQVETFLKSEDLTQRLQKSTGRGSEEVLKSIMSVISKSYSDLGSDATAKLIGGYVQSKVDEDTYYSDGAHFVGPARVLDAMISDPKYEAIKPKLLEYEATLQAKINTTNAFFPTSEDALGMNDPGFQYANQPYFFHMMERNKSKIAADINSAIQARDATHLGPLEIRYLYHHPASFNGNQQREVAFLSLEAIAHNKGFGEENDIDLTDESIGMLRAYVVANPGQKSQITERFHAILLNSSNPEMLAKALHWSYGDMMKDTIKRDPMFSMDFVQTLARRTFLALPKQSNGAINENVRTLGILFEKLLPALTSDPKRQSSGAALEVPLLPDPKLDGLIFNRSRPPTQSAKTIQVQDMSSAEVLDQTLVWALRNYREANTEALNDLTNSDRRTSGSALFMTILNDDKARKMLKGYSDWKQELQTLISDDAANKTKYHRDLQGLSGFLK